MKNKKYTCLLFGEGRKDKKFLYALSGLAKFKHHTKNWYFRFGNAHGCCASRIIELCKKESTGAEDVILCFIDLDDLKGDYPESWEKEMKKMEKDASRQRIVIIWQRNNAEDEYEKVLGKECGKGKNEKNKAAIANIEKFINSNFWKRILKPFFDFEEKQK